MSGTTANSAILIIYDGACPFCSRYTAWLRLRESVGQVTLLDARSDDERVRQLADQGLDFDSGMVVVIGSAVHHGAEAMHQLALLCDDGDVFNRLNRWIMTRQRLSRWLYPVLRAGRRWVLRIRGTGLIRNGLRP